MGRGPTKDQIRRKNRLQLVQHGSTSEKYILMLTIKCHTSICTSFRPENRGVWSRQPIIGFVVLTPQTRWLTNFDPAALNASVSTISLLDQHLYEAWVLSIFMWDETYPPPPIHRCTVPRRHSTLISLQNAH
jgi:hypothetical protein